MKKRVVRQGFFTNIISLVLIILFVSGIVSFEAVVLSFLAPVFIQTTNPEKVWFEWDV